MTKEKRMPLLSHLEELRKRLIISAVAILAASIVAFLLRNQIFDLLIEPWRAVAEERDLAFFRPTEAFTLFMRLSLFAGFVIASPVVIWQMWGFVSPALTDRERRYAVPGAVVLMALFLVGVWFGYWALERGLGFLIDFGGDSLDPTIGGSFYLSFAMRFILVFGLAFEFPVFLFTAAALGAVSHRRLAGARRWAIMIIVSVGAIVTPSGDPLTLLLLSAPLYLLYEATLLAIRLFVRR